MKTFTGDLIMAKNTGDGYRKGSVNDRTQSQTPSGNWVKRDTDNGRFMDQKQGGDPFKGVAKEKDGRRG
jgi:hypothetical protein